MSEQEKQFDKDLRDLSAGLDREIKAHDFKADAKRTENRWFTLAIQICSAAVMLLSGGAAYLQGDAATAFAWLGLIFGAINYGLTSWYDKWAPGEERSHHIIAIAQKSGIQGKINLQLMASPEDRQDPVDFYRWIHEQHSSIESATPYLSGSLLAKFNDDHPKKD